MAMNTTGTQTEENLRNSAEAAKDTVQAEISALRAKVETLMSDRVSPAVSRIVDRAENVAGDAAATVREQANRLSDTVQERPIAALAVAAIAGFITAHLLRR
ncbi:hypothetical protein [Plastoroseomonas arctica]|uniref:DUF883 domain-containing protein n=1 Tax=Plastoroseomonas arctica TaxID=1509237 RepID=A0AAF1K140_9PROT|nr:hypothetical protein [Plastoroseomonas arctica]MBR0654395.1 hypothetical protein [Plastoroseomonas arctica]